MSANVITDRFSGQSRGFGFVEMSTQDEAHAAIAKLDGQPFGGRRHKVAMANPSAMRSARPRKEDDRQRSATDEPLVSATRTAQGNPLAPFAFRASDTGALVRQTLRDRRLRSE